MGTGLLGMGSLEVSEEAESALKAVDPRDRRNWELESDRKGFFCGRLSRQGRSCRFLGRGLAKPATLAVCRMEREGISLMNTDAEATISKLGMTVSREKPYLSRSLSLVGDSRGFCWIAWDVLWVFLCNQTIVGGNRPENDGLVGKEGRLREETRLMDNYQTHRTGYCETRLSGVSIAMP